LLSTLQSRILEVTKIQIKELELDICRDGEDCLLLGSYEKQWVDIWMDIYLGNDANEYVKHPQVIVSDINYNLRYLLFIERYEYLIVS